MAMTLRTAPSAAPEYGRARANVEVVCTKDVVAHAVAVHEEVVEGPRQALAAVLVPRILPGDSAESIGEFADDGAEVARAEALGLLGNRRALPLGALGVVTLAGFPDILDGVVPIA
jgi:hypothetical protein